MNNWQGGQALPLMVVLLVVMSGAFVLLFNTGQLLTSRAELSAASDHVVSAVATEEARLLNLNAYLNRAAIANQLAVAQDVSMASWAAYTQPIPERASILLTPPMTPIGVVVTESAQVLASTMRPIGESMAAFVIQNQLTNVLIRAHQKSLNGIYYPYLLRQVPKDVLTASGMSEKGVRFHYLPTSGLLTSFISQYTGDDRQRLSGVMMDSRERFTRARVRWDQGMGLAKCSKFFPGVPYFELIKRGGTDLQGLDAWKGMDTFSLHTYIGEWKSRKLRLPRWVCQHSEYPIGYGSSLMNKKKEDNDPKSSQLFDGSWESNPSASDDSSTSYMSWDSRKRLTARAPAVPEYYDISSSARTSGKDELVVTMALSRQVDSLPTASHKSALKTGKLIEQYEDFPNNKMVAVSKAIVYFQRPHDGYLNQGKIEKASLFNPYWRVKMARLKSADRLGALLP